MTYVTIKRVDKESRYIILIHRFTYVYVGEVIKITHVKIKYTRRDMKLDHLPFVFHRINQLIQSVNTNVFRFLL